MNFGIIADGNRRWAKKNNVSFFEGHRQGFLAIKNEILPELKKSKLFSSCTVYGFSTENWKRDRLEVKNLMKLFVEIFDNFLEELLAEKIRLFHVGKKNRLPKILQKKIQKAEILTEKNKNFNFYLCLNYGGRDEILRTFELISQKKIKKINEKNFSKYLEVPNLDIILRTGGEKRISNFCIWQGAYAELFFLDKFLPDIKKNDIKNIIKTFYDRDRRKGA